MVRLFKEENGYGKSFKIKNNIIIQSGYLFLNLYVYKMQQFPFPISQ